MTPPRQPRNEPAILDNYRGVGADAAMRTAVQAEPFSTTIRQLPQPPLATGNFTCYYFASAAVAVDSRRASAPSSALLLYWQACASALHVFCMLDKR